jgi:hypothetical protein
LPPINDLYEPDRKAAELQEHDKFEQDLREKEEKNKRIRRLLHEKYIASQTK